LFKLLAVKCNSPIVTAVHAELKVLGFMQTGHTAGVSSVNFSPDGKQIVSASWDESLKLWDLAGNCLQTFVLNPKV
jgi:WD40 repeat protein